MNNKEQLQNLKKIPELQSQLDDIMNNEVLLSSFPKLNVEIFDSQRIERAISYLKSTGGTLNFDETTSYTINKQIVVEANINLKSNKLAKIIRVHKKELGYSSFLLKGNNIISGINYVGKDSDYFESDYVNYCDFFIQGDNVTIEKCMFDKSRGSFVLYGDFTNIVIQNNLFKSYDDHCIYGGGRINNSDTRFIKIIDNHFVNINNREIIKIRNGVSNYHIVGNTVNNSNAIFICLDCGDITGDKINKDILISNNSGTCKTFISSYSKTIPITNININDNIIKTTEYLFLFGRFPDSTTIQNCTCLENINISDNTFEFSNQAIFNINKDVPADIKFNNNTLKTTSNKVFTLIGGVREIYIDNNTFIVNSDSSDSSTTIIDLYHYNDLGYTFMDNVIGYLKIFNNVIKGNVQTFLYENNTQNQKSLVHWDIDVKYNTINTPTFKLININGDKISNITCCLTEINNSGKANLSDSSWGSNKIIKNSRLMDRLLKSLTVTIPANSSVTADISGLENVNQQSCVIANPLYGITTGVTWNVFASNKSVRLCFYNSTNSPVNFNGNFIITVIN